MKPTTVNNPFESKIILISLMHKALRLAGHSTDKLEIKEEMQITPIEGGAYRTSFINEYAEVYLICTPKDDTYEVSEPQINKIKDIPRAVLANTTPYNPDQE